jgi:hypothetical protein
MPLRMSDEQGTAEVTHRSRTAPGTAVPRPSEDDRGTISAGQGRPEAPDPVGRVGLEPTTNGLKVLARA